MASMHILFSERCTVWATIWGCDRQCWLRLLGKSRSREEGFGISALVVLEEPAGSDFDVSCHVFSPLLFGDMIAIDDVYRNKMDVPLAL